MREYITQLVGGVVSKVPAPVIGVTKSKTFMAGCGVLGAALTAYSTGECTGTQAIAGACLGGSIIFQRLATEKLFQAVLKGR